LFYASVKSLNIAVIFYSYVVVELLSAFMHNKILTYLLFVYRCSRWKLSK